MTKELLPGPGSGALREALEQIASITCGCHDSADANWHGKRCPKGIALAALSLSSPIEPPPQSLPFTNLSCGCFIRYSIERPCRTHFADAAVQPAPQASSEVREAQVFTDGKDICLNIGPVLPTGIEIGDTVGVALLRCGGTKS